MARPPYTQVIDNHNKKYTYPFALFMGIGVVKRLLPKGPKRLENLLCHFVFCLRACLPSPIYETVRHYKTRQLSKLVYAKTSFIIPKFNLNHAKPFSAFSKERIVKILKFSPIYRWDLNPSQFHKH